MHVYARFQNLSNYLISTVTNVSQLLTAVKWPQIDNSVLTNVKYFQLTCAFQFHNRRKSIVTEIQL